MPLDAVSCRGVVKIYWTETGEVHALKGIDADFPEGTLTAVMGPSGSGKSSLLRILAGMDHPTAGSVRIRGIELSGRRWGELQRVRRRQVGYVFQRPSDNLIPHLTVEGHLRLAARVRRPFRRLRFEDIIELLGLARLRSALPRQLSGGEQQRLAFAQAVVGQPSIVVADEPTAELDSATAQGVLDIVTLIRARGTSVVVATHDPDVQSVANTTLHLRHGAIESETRHDRELLVIDEGGRVQIPPQALARFPQRRAAMTLDGRGIKLDPP